jgi:hypothetical protein
MKKKIRFEVKQVQVQALPPTLLLRLNRTSRRYLSEFGQNGMSETQITTFQQGNFSLTLITWFHTFPKKYQFGEKCDVFNDTKAATSLQKHPGILYYHTKQTSTYDGK